MRARVVQAAADFGLLLSNFRPGSIIAWLSANTSSEQTWTTPRIYCSSRRPIDWKHIGRRLRTAKTDCCVFNRIMTRWRAFRSKRRRRSGWWTNECEHDLVYVLLSYIIGTIFLYMRVLDVYTCVQGDALTRDIVFLNFKYLCIKCILRLLYHML